MTPKEKAQFTLLAAHSASIRQIECAMCGCGMETYLSAELTEVGAVLGFYAQGWRVAKDKHTGNVGPYCQRCFNIHSGGILREGG